MVTLGLGTAHGWFWGLIPAAGLLIGGSTLIALFTGVLGPPPCLYYYGSMPPPVADTCPPRIFAQGEVAILFVLGFLAVCFSLVGMSAFLRYSSALRQQGDKNENQKG